MQTVEEKKEYQKKYREINKDKINTYGRSHYAKNKDKISAYRKAYRLKYGEKKRTYNKIYCVEHRKEDRIRSKEYYIKHKKQKKISRKLYYEANKEKILVQCKNYGIINKDKMNAHRRKRYKTDLKFKLNKITSNLIWWSLKGNKNNRHWEDIVRYTLKDLIKRLKKTLPKGYKWSDYVSGKANLHIDHIVPIAVHNFKSYKDTDFQRCWALKNLQLLPAQDNQIKHAKLDKPFQPSLLI